MACIITFKDFNRAITLWLSMMHCNGEGTMEKSSVNRDNDNECKEKTKTLWPSSNIQLRLNVLVCILNCEFWLKCSFNIGKNGPS